MSSTTTLPEPQFAAVMRGYDRPQVDEYTRQLHAWLSEAERRARMAESALEEARRDAAMLRQRLGDVDDGQFTATPPSIQALGERVGQLLGASLEAARALREGSGAPAGTDGRLLSPASPTLTSRVDDAVQRVQEVTRAADALMQEAEAHAAVAADAVARRLRTVRVEVAQEREAMLQKVRAECCRRVAAAHRQEQEARRRMDQAEARLAPLLERGAELHRLLGLALAMSREGAVPALDRPRD